MNSLVSAMYAQIFYMIGMGVGFLFIPNIILPLFGFAPSNEVWIRILGALALCFASYYYAMTSQQNITFFWATVWGRYGFCACLAVLVLLQIGPTPLYLFAALETVLAIWTHWALLKLEKPT